MPVRRFAVFAALTLCCSLSFAQPWDVPEARRSKVSSFIFTPEAVAQGQLSYTQYCVSCHGDPGKNNALASLNPVPSDPASELVQKNSDGELFYKISEGRLIMPSFRDILTEEQKWLVIAYIRSFNKEYVQPVYDAAASLADKVRVELSYDSVTSVLRVLVKAAAEDDSILLAGAEVSIFAKRYFGNLQIDSVRRTGDNGVAVFNFPADLPTDTAGMAGIIVKINDDIYGEVTAGTKIKAGVMNDAPGLTDERAIWNVGTKAPLWLLFTYAGLLIGIWSFLFYIIRGLLKINKLGKNST